MTHDSQPIEQHDRQYQVGDVMVFGGHKYPITGRMEAEGFAEFLGPRELDPVEKVHRRKKMRLPWKHEGAFIVSEPPFGSGSCFTQYPDHRVMHMTGVSTWGNNVHPGAGQQGNLSTVGEVMAGTPASSPALEEQGEIPEAPIGYEVLPISCPNCDAEIADVAWGTPSVSCPTAPVGDGCGAVFAVDWTGIAEEIFNEAEAEGDDDGEREDAQHTTA